MGLFFRTLRAGSAASELAMEISLRAGINRPPNTALVDFSSSQLAAAWRHESITLVLRRSAFINCCEARTENSSFHSGGRTLVPSLLPSFPACAQD